MISNPKEPKMRNAILKLIITVFMVMAVGRQLPNLHKTAKIVFAKNAQKGFSPLEKFNDKLWRK